MANEPGALPGPFRVTGAHPNPAGGALTVRSDLPARAEVGLTVYVCSGAPPSSRRRRHSKPAPVVLDVSGLPSGVYVYRVEAALTGGAERASGRPTVVC